MCMDRLHRRTWQRLGQYFTVFLLGWLFLGYSSYLSAPVYAQQSQDYINGLVEGQLRSLSQRLDNIEKLMWFLGTCITGVLITQWIGLRNQRAENKAQSDERSQSRIARTRYLRETGRAGDDEEDGGAGSGPGSRGGGGGYRS